MLLVCRSTFALAPPRRIQKDDKIAGQKTRYYHNHDWQVLAEYNDSGVHQRSYIYGATLSPLHNIEPLQEVKFCRLLLLYLPWR